MAASTSRVTPARRPRVSAATCSSSCASSGSASCAIRAATSSRATTGATASGRRRATAPARPGVEVDRDQRVRHRRVRGLVPRRGGRAHARDQPRPRRRAIGPRTCSSTPTTPRARTLSESARQRRREPHDVRLWCLGNELDGPWQLGHRRPRTTPNWPRPRRRRCGCSIPTLELVAVGSSNADMPTFGTGRRPCSRERSTSWTTSRATSTSTTTATCAKFCARRPCSTASSTMSRRRSSTSRPRPAARAT